MSRRKSMYETMNDIQFATELLVNPDLKLAIVANMREHAGHFVKTLTEPIMAADYPNTVKLVITFRQYFNMYLPEKWPEVKE